MLYLEAWDTFVPASFKGAQPVCYYCRQAGHVKKNCPSLKLLKCFKYGDSGHTKRRCRSGNVKATRIDDLDTTPSFNSTFEEDLLEYEKLQKESSSHGDKERLDHMDYLTDERATEHMAVQTSAEIYEIDNPVSEVNFEQSNDLSTFEDAAMMNDNMFDENVRDRNEETADFQRTLNGSLASKHAPITIRTTTETDEVRPKRTSRPRKGVTKKVSGTQKNDDTTTVNNHNNNPIDSNARQGHE
ncbi:hypothetical protein BDF21DRAFT_222749 [Thamnidium elegans]|nr:hypothetical protein BDF21DRAFT_222749 [Thamnidium elegans]